MIRFFIAKWWLRCYSLRNEDEEEKERQPYDYAYQTERDHTDRSGMVFFPKRDEHETN